jgi:hypothetical protein
MDGEGLDAVHNGVRVDDVVDPSPRLSGTTVAEQGRGESGRRDMLASVGVTSSEVERSGKNYSWSHDSTSKYAILCAGVFLHLVPGDRGDVCVARSLGGGRYSAARGRGNGLSNGGDHHVSAATHLVSQTSDKAQHGLGR